MERFPAHRRLVLDAMELMFAIFCVFLTPRLVDGFSAREIRDIVYVHNEVRRRVEASDMSYLVSSVVTPRYAL